MPRVLEAFRREEFDRTIMNELGEVGFLGVMTSEQYGGSGLGYVAYGLIAGRSSGSTRATARR